MTVLTTTTGLLCILLINIDFLGEGLLVGNLRSADIGLNLELSEQTVYQDLQMQLTHAGDDRLTGLRIGVCTEGRILLGKLSQSLTHLALIILCLRLDCELDNRLRELHGLQNNRMLLITDRITGRCGLETNRSGDVTGIYLVQFGTVVSVHLQDTADTLLLSLGRIQYVGTGVQRTGVNAEKCELSDKRISHDLECQCRERLIIG